MAAVSTDDPPRSDTLLKAVPTPATAAGVSGVAVFAVPELTRGCADLPSPDLLSRQRKAAERAAHPCLGTASSQVHRPSLGARQRRLRAPSKPPPLDGPITLDDVLSRRRLVKRRRVRGAAPVPSSSPVTPRHANDQQQQQQQQGGDHAGVRKGRGVAEEKMVSPRPETPLSAPSDTARPVYVASRELLRACCRVPVYKQRDLMVHELIHACGLLRHVRVFQPPPATREDLLQYHDPAFLDMLEECSKALDGSNCVVPVEERQECGLVDDCPPFPHMFKYCLRLVGAALNAARVLVSGRANLAFCLVGGRHHARKSEAAGFCYINDCVIAILALQRRYKRVLYIDIDVHHGDGVEEAFAASRSVMTLSFHHHAPGFFPGSGKSHAGLGRARGLGVNVPLPAGVGDDDFRDCFCAVAGRAMDSFLPDAIVMVMGADALAADPLGALSLSYGAYTDAFKFVRQRRPVPTLVLGGGGYVFTDAARCWTRVVAAGCGRLDALPADVPHHSFFPQYGPRFSMSDMAPKGRRKVVPMEPDEKTSFLSRLCRHVRAVCKDGESD